MNELLSKEKSLGSLEPGVAPITREAPVVTSGPRKEPDSFALLRKLCSRATEGYQITRGKSSAKLVWPGLRLSSAELLELLKSLPRVKRVHAAVKVGEATKSLSFDGKLRKSSLVPPDEEGLVLFWKRAPEELSRLALPESEESSAFRPMGEKLSRFTLKAGGKRLKATLYGAADLQVPGIFFLNSGELLLKLEWREFGVQAPNCQIVIDGDLDWSKELPDKLVDQCRKLAKLARARSCEFTEEGAGSKAQSGMRASVESSKLRDKIGPIRSDSLARPSSQPEPASVHLAKVGPNPPAPQQDQVTPNLTVSASTPAGAGHEDLAERLQDSPRFQAAYQSLKEEKPPLVTVLQILEMLCHGGGQVPLETVRERIGLPEHRLTTILVQMDGMLRGADEILLSLSIDQNVLLLDRERLSKLFALDIATDEANVVRAETMSGEKRAVRLPIEVKVKERRALETLLRYGRLSEQELSRITSSRRVGGMLERLLSRLEGEGYYGLSVVGEGPEGRIFSLQ